MRDASTETHVTDISTETYECENCGGLLKFNIARQKFACESCGAEKDIGAAGSKVAKNDFDRYTEREKNSVAFTGMASVSCQRCGMEMAQQMMPNMQPMEQPMQ